MMVFERDIHTAMWGEEEWLVSAHRTAPSRIRGENRTLRDVCPDFPLLVKLIRAEQRLSVQVHPNELTAASVGGEPKTEMWCVLRAGPIYAGFREGVTREDVERAVVDGSFERLLVRFDTKAGECYFIPGGLVHAIGEGTTVFEVQQSSDTTFRLYDWGRYGLDGHPRRLHVAEALAAMDIALPPPVATTAVSCPFFDFRQQRAGEATPTDAWRVIYVPSIDEARLLPPGEKCTLAVDSLVTTVGAGT